MLRRHTLLLIAIRLLDGDVKPGGPLGAFREEQATSRGPGGSSGKALSCGLDGPGSIPGVGGVEIFLPSFVSRLALGYTQPPIK